MYWDLTWSNVPFSLGIKGIKTISAEQTAHWTLAARRMNTLQVLKCCGLSDRRQDFFACAPWVVHDNPVLRVPSGPTGKSLALSWKGLMKVRKMHVKDCLSPAGSSECQAWDLLRQVERISRVEHCGFPYIKMCSNWHLQWVFSALKTKQGEDN